MMSRAELHACERIVNCKDGEYPASQGGICGCEPTGGVPPLEVPNDGGLPIAAPRMSLYSVRPGARTIDALFGDSDTAIGALGGAHESDVAETLFLLGEDGGGFLNP